MDAPLVCQLIDAYLADRRLDLAAGKIDRKHFDRLNRYLNVFRKDHGEKSATELPRKILRCWLRDHPEWKSGYTCEDACGSVISCLRWAQDEEAWKGAAVAVPRRPNDLIPGKPVRRPLSEAEYKGIIHESRQGGRRKSRRAFRFAMKFLWRTGARTCEMREALVENLDLLGAGLRVRHKTQRKTGGMRTIPLDRVLVRLLGFLVAHRRLGQTTIFANGRGRPWKCQAFADLFRLLARKVGVPESVSCYCTRHSFTCRARAAGVSADDVADVTGNSPATIRKHYDAWQRTQADHLQRIMSAVNGRPAG